VFNFAKVLNLHKMYAFSFYDKKGCGEEGIARII